MDQLFLNLSFRISVGPYLIIMIVDLLHPYNSYISNLNHKNTIKTSITL